jgi:hypothetical protein
MIPVNWIGLIASTAGEENSPSFSLLPNIFLDIGSPDGVIFPREWILVNIYGLGGTQGDTSLTGYTVKIIRPDLIIRLIIMESIETTLFHTDQTFDAFFFIPYYGELAG